VVEVGLYETMCQHSPDIFAASCHLSGDLISFVCYSLFIFTAVVVGCQIIKGASHTPPAARSFKTPLALKKDKLFKQIASSTALVRLTVSLIHIQKHKNGVNFPSFLNYFRNYSKKFYKDNDFHF